MKISVNLATRPYVELRPIFLRLRVLMAALAVVALALGVWGHMLTQRRDRAQAQMDALRNRTTAAQQERLHEEAKMRQPVNAAVLERAHFLNGLFLRKSFSWTAVMMDLENVLPTGVLVTAIEPQVDKQGNVIIRLRVSGERDRAVQLVRNLESSRRFLLPRLNGEATQAKEAGHNGAPVAAAASGPIGTEFDILADYNPLPANEPYHFTKPREEHVVAASPALMSRPVAAVAPVRVPPASSVPAAASPALVRGPGPAYPPNGVVLPPHRPLPPGRPFGPQPQGQPPQQQGQGGTR